MDNKSLKFKVGDVITCGPETALNFIENVNNFNKLPLLKNGLADVSVPYEEIYSLEQVKKFTFLIIGFLNTKGPCRYVVVNLKGERYVEPRFFLEAYFEVVREVNVEHCQLLFG